MYKINRSDIYIIILVIVLSIVSLLIIKDFIIPLIFTGILVYLFHPLYRKVNKYINSHFVTSMFSIFLILIIIILPTVLTIFEVSKEFSTLENTQITSSLNTLSTLINSEYNSNLNLSKEYFIFLEKANTWLKDILYNGLPKFVFNVFIIIFFFYYFLKNYDKESSYFKNFFKQQTLKNWEFKIRNLLNGIVYGQILVRLIQAGIGTLLFLLIGVKGAIIWGVLMFFAAFLPLVGTALVWVPVMFLNVLQNRFDLAIYIFVIGLIISSVDNLLLPYFISDKTNMGPVITLISILGGLQLFGIYGIILGPFFLGLLFVTVDELIIKIKKMNPETKRYIWSKTEREKFKGLKTKQAQKEFIRIMHNKYKREEEKGVREVCFRY